MGFSSRQTAKKVVTSRIPWQPAPDDQDWVTTDGMRGFLATARILARASALGDVTSSWLEPRKSTHAEIATTSLRSMLRVRLSGPSSVDVDLGAPSPFCKFQPDWLIRIAFDSATGCAELTTPAFRTRDNSLVNAPSYQVVKALIAEVVSIPPVVSIEPGPLDVEGTVRRLVLAPASPFKDDYLSPGPLSFTHGCEVVVAEADAMAVRDALLGSLRAVSGSAYGADAAVDVAPGASTDALLVMRINKESSKIQLHCPEFEALTEPAKHRIRRTFLRTLDKPGIGELSKIEPLNSACIAWANVDGEAVPTSWTSLASTTEPGVALEPTVGMKIPIGVRVGSPEPVASWSDRAILGMAHAESSLLVRSRSWTRGLRAKAREENRILTQRRGAYLDSDATVWRYIHSSPTQLSRYHGIGADFDPTAFWEVRCQPWQSPSGEGGWSAWSSGLAVAHGQIAYGPEMLRLLQAWGTIASRHPDATIETLYLTL